MRILCVPMRATCVAIANVDRGARARPNGARERERDRDRATPSIVVLRTTERLSPRDRARRRSIDRADDGGKVPLRARGDAEFRARACMGKQCARGRLAAVDVATWLVSWARARVMGVRWG